MGLTSTNLGTDTQLGSTWSRPSVVARERAHVFGFLKTSGTVQPQNNVIVDGLRQEQVAITPIETRRTVTFDSNNSGPVSLEPDLTRTLAPGRYSDATLKSRSQLFLSTGTYYFDSLSTEPTSKVWLNKAQGPIYIYVKSSFSVKGELKENGGRIANVLFGYFGTSVANVETPFLGTLVAPNAKIYLATVGGEGHRGAFFGKDVDVQAETKVTHFPFGITLTKRWAVADSASQPITQAAVRSDGSVLAVTDHRAYSINGSGVRSELFADANATRLFLNPAGNAFGVYDASDVRLFNASGAPIRTFPRVPFGYAKFVPGSTTVFWPDLQQGLEAARVTNARFVAASGSSTAFTATGLQVSRVTAQNLVYSDATSLRRASLAGVESFRFNGAVSSFEASSDASRIIVQLPGNRSVRHVSGSSVLPVVNVDGPIWELAMAADGNRSAALTEHTAYVFSNGALLASTPLPFAFVSSAAISSRGELLCGGKSADSTASVLVFDDGGQLLAQVVTTPDEQAHRPGVIPAPDGNSFLVRERSGLSLYDIERGL
ncbi:MAG: hypothetical protein ABUL60_09965 [Myxococcales bacterium]